MQLHQWSRARAPCARRSPRGSRSAEDHLRFEAIVTALVPDECSQLELGRAVCELLGIHHEQLTYKRAGQEQSLTDGQKARVVRELLV